MGLLRARSSLPVVDDLENLSGWKSFRWVTMNPTLRRGRAAPLADDVAVTGPRIFPLRAHPPARTFHRGVGLDVIAVPEILREKLGPEGAGALVDLFNRAAAATRDEVVLLAEQRFARRLGAETGRLWEAISSLETRMTERMASFETRMTERMASLETRLTDRMASLETRLTDRMGSFETGTTGSLAALETRVAHKLTVQSRWMVGLFIAQTGVLAGLLALFLRA